MTPVTATVAKPDNAIGTAQSHLIELWEQWCYWKVRHIRALLHDTGSNCPSTGIEGI